MVTPADAGNIPQRVEERSCEQGRAQEGQQPLDEGGLCDGIELRGPVVGRLGGKDLWVQEFGKRQRRQVEARDYQDERQKRD